MTRNTSFDAASEHRNSGQYGTDVRTTDPQGYMTWAKGGIAGREEAAYHLLDRSEAPASAAAGASCEAGAAAAQVRESSRRYHARELI
jgi:hypothetical protein